MNKKYSRQDVLMRGWGERLKAARIHSGFRDAEDMARHLGLGASRYRTYERGEAMAPAEILEMICDATDSSLDWLILGRSPGDSRQAGRTAGADPTEH